MLAAKRKDFEVKQAIAPLSDAALTDMIGELEFQIAELEMEKEDLEKKVKTLDEQLVEARNGKIYEDFVKDGKNFVNLISRQGTLVENLRNEKKQIQ